MGQAPLKPMQSAKTIVVAEDDASSRELVREILEAQGYHVIEAMDGHDALEKIENFHPDLVVMDIQMPGAGRLDIIGRIRDDHRSAGLRVMAVAAQANADAVDHITARAFDTHL